jgi:ribosomal protein S18 acetylase RimI-like enzyme
VIRRLAADDIDACAALLERLPEWFGIPEANAAYTASLAHLVGFVAVDEEDADRVLGFLALVRHNAASAEISVMGVDPTCHREGIGRALVDTAERWCRDEDVVWLHVKTRGPSTYDDDYERTRRFYAGVGFTPLYESLTEWGPANAALVMVKHLGPR